MIIGIFLNLVYLAVLVAMSPLLALPVATLSSDFSNAITIGGSYMSALNFVLPIPTLVTILGLSISFEVGYFTFKGIMWIIRRFPTQS